MKFKSLIFSALCLSAVAFTSCDGEKEATYVPAQPVEVPEVYFNLGDDSTLINLGDTDTDVKFTLYRKNATGTLTTSLSYTAVTYNAKAQNPNKVAADKTLFTVPSSVTFADGKNDVEITMTLDPTVLDANNIYEVTFTVGDGEVTPYFSQVLAYKLKYNPFEDVIGPNGETKAILRDFVMTTWFGIEELEFEVTLQKSPAIPGLYRLVNPYGMDFPYNEEADLDGKVHYLYLNAANPKAVFMCNASGDALEADGSFAIYATGMSWNWTDYGEVLVTGMYNLRMAQKNEAEANKNVGTLEDGILTFAPKTWLARMDIYTTPGNWSYAAKNGFYLRWPGVEEPEPEPGPEPDEEWVGIGACEYTDVFIYPMYGVEEPVTWDVEVEKNTKTPGVFRMVNPYKTGVMPDGYNYSGDLYIELDCTNPDVVEVPMANTGWIGDEDGVIYICNKGWFYIKNQGKDADYVIQNGFNDTYISSTYTVALQGLNAFCRWPNANEAATGTKPNSLYTHKIDFVGGLVMNAQAAAQAKMSIATARTTPSHFSKLLVKAGFNVDKPTKIKKHAVKKIDSKIVVK